ncbi:hypothetical protein Poly51_29380 [Rubripirellula tenax]|uniref:Tetratricopeptide repeat protein n=1 Tax=Rubripirellula tenax TaxID=2528015 RepID=A0A5C6F9A1_9BACT|nr:hypothetical protein [Rubripirellula tenax]TWU57017.1 hypothetical protein Poly51_29380 [Rubripirellula tenax]
MKYSNLAVVLTLVVSMSVAAPAADSIVGRTSDNATADLVDALVDRSRFDEAEALCDRLTGVDSDPLGDGVARAAIYQSRVRTARTVAGVSFDAAAEVAASEPVAQLLASYPDHPRRLFLASQELAVRRAAARFAVTALAVDPNAASHAGEVTSRLLASTSAMDGLADQVRAKRQSVQRDRSIDNVALADDLLRLEQELLVETVSISLLQAEVFSALPNDSSHSDGIAAATKAEQAADEAIARLSAESTARREINRLRVEAILRSGDRKRASELFANLSREYSKPLPPAMVAVAARIELAGDELVAAGKIVNSFYGDDLMNAPPSVEMDLVRLRYLLEKMQTGDGNARQVAQWIEMIGRRGGPYATRRAEAISLARMRSGGSAATVEASLIAAQGRDWLRRGDAVRAAELLAAAASAEADPDASIRHALEAAAAWSSIDEAENAAIVLAATATNKPSATDAAKIHMHSVLMFSKLDDAAARQDAIIDMLRDHLTNWASGETANAAHQWLIKILDADEDKSKAAEASLIRADALTPTEWNRALDLWQNAMLSTPSDRLGEFSEHVAASFKPASKIPSAASVYRVAIATMGDRESLRIAEPLTKDGDDFLSAVIRCRVSGQFNLQTPVPADGLSAATRRCLIRRLMQDGIEDPPLRKPIAQWIQRWPEADDSVLDQATRYLWLARPDDAIRVLDEHIATDPNTSETLFAAAESLAASTDIRAREKAIDYLDRVAAGSPSGSPSWHRAKTAAIELLVPMNRGDEAKRRADYIRLTLPTMDAQTKRRYQSLSDSVGKEGSQ